MDVTTEPSLIPAPPRHLPFVDIFQITVVVIGLVGVIGNGLTLLVFTKAKQFGKSVGGMLVINQTVVDLVCSIILIVTHGYKMRPLSVYQGGMDSLLCFLIHAEVLLYISLTVSIYSLVLITLERYLMVLHPITHRVSFTKRRAALMIIFTWIFGSIIPIFGNINATYINKNGLCLVHAGGSKEGRKISNIVYFVQTYIVPVMLFVAAYSRIWWIFVKKKYQVGPKAPTAPNGLSTVSGNCQQNTTMENNRSGPRKLTRSQVNFTKMAILIVTAFIILWMPVEIQTMLLNMEVPVFLGLRGYKVALSLSFINCIINPFIYAFQMENFKKAFAKYVCPYRCTRETDGASATGNLVSTLGISHGVQSAEVMVR